MRSPLLLAIALGLAGCAHGSTTVPNGMRTCHGVTIPESVASEGRTLQLNGMAVRDVTVFAVDVYVGALYLEQPTTDADAVVSSEQGKRMQLRFLRGVTRQDIVNAFESGFVNNAGTERLGLGAEIREFLTFFGDVEDDAEMTFDYVPGRGLTYRLDGIERGTIANPAFGRAFFLVFVGAQPPSRQLRDGLLGGPCD